MDAELVDLADRMARRWYLPGADRDDVRQLARIAAWESTLCYRPELGTTPRHFAALVIGRRLREELTLARRLKHEPLTGARRVALGHDGELVDVLDLIPDARADVGELVEQRERVRRLTAAAATLSPLERETLAGVLSGRVAPTESKTVDNALQRARAKLRAA